MDRDPERNFEEKLDTIEEIDAIKAAIATEMVNLSALLEAIRNQGEGGSRDA